MLLFSHDSVQNAFVVEFKALILLLLIDEENEVSWAILESFTHRFQLWVRWHAQAGLETPKLLYALLLDPHIVPGSYVHTR
jgi:hypothetical protein